MLLWSVSSRSCRVLTFSPFPFCRAGEVYWNSFSWFRPIETWVKLRAIDPSSRQDLALESKNYDEPKSSMVANLQTLAVTSTHLLMLGSVHSPYHNTTTKSFCILILEQIFHRKKSGNSFRSARRWLGSKIVLSENTAVKIDTSSFMLISTLNVAMSKRKSHDICAAIKILWKNC
jgi:hypothetical protein